LSPGKVGKVYGFFQEWTGVDGFPEEIARLCGCTLPPHAAFGERQTIRELPNIALADRRTGNPWWRRDGEAAETRPRKPEIL